MALNDNLTVPETSALPLGDGTFRMVPSGDIVDAAERDRRLAQRGSDVVVTTDGPTPELVVALRHGYHHGHHTEYGAPVDLPADDSRRWANTRTVFVDPRDSNLKAWNPHDPTHRRDPNDPTDPNDPYHLPSGATVTSVDPTDPPVTPKVPRTPKRS